jgi:thiol:disulfide interchange protein
MKTRLPRGLMIVALFQFIAPVILPPAILTSISPFLWGLLLVVFGFLGYNLMHRRAWSRLATVFVQGFSIIVHLLVGVSHAVVKGPSGPVADVWLLSTFAISVLLSGAILYYVDLPEVQALMQ